MKKLIHDDFLLQSDSAQRLYHEVAKTLPIIDYHCHLPPQEIAENQQWDNLTQIWLGGDHYKWRAMRANGINERYITGDAPDREKFDHWAATMPYALRNPLYHWSHLELTRYFGIDDLLLSPKTADEIWERSLNVLPGISARQLITDSKVEVICTTDDPIDSLEHHHSIAEDSSFATKVLPTWRPDKCLAVEDTLQYNAYLDKLEVAADQEIRTYDDLISALKIRQISFEQQGCRLADHGLNTVFAADFTEAEIRFAFDKIRSGNELKPLEIEKFKSSVMLDLARMNYEKGWTTQLHIGAMRNNSSRQFKTLGPDSGFDSMEDRPLALNLSKFLDRLDSNGRLGKTILYNLNPTHNTVMATMAGNFQDGEIPGKIQWGSGWWFMDQLDGMTDQINILSQQGLLRRFVGMLTDSRSFLSYTRHEYFRRLLCNIIGTDIENGLLPNDPQLMGSLIEEICYKNASEYFQF